MRSMAGEGEGSRRSKSAAAQAMRAPREAFALPTPARGRRLSWFRRRNRRIVVQRPSLAVWVSDAIIAVGRRLLAAGKLIALMAALVLVVQGGRLAMRQMVASPRFAVREIRVSPTPHVTPDEVRTVSGVAIGDRLLAVDTDAVAARLTTHPWILAAHVRRELPGTLVLDITERRAAAAAMLGDLYLVDETGRPFKRATLNEADGLVVLTGVDRARYLNLREASEAAFREALSLLATYNQAPGAAPSAPTRAAGRPVLSEVHIDPRNGFSLFVLDGGAEIRIGRGDFASKLERLDRIFAVASPTALRTVHLDGPAPDRVPVRLSGNVVAAAEGTAMAPAAPTGSGAAVAPAAKKSTRSLNAVISAKAASSPSNSALRRNGD